MSNKRVLFVENFKIFEKWASKTYPFKCQKIKEDTRFEVYDFGSGLSHIEPSDYEVIIFGWHGVSINKYYTTKQQFYSKYVDMLEEQQDIDDILEPLLYCDDVPKYVMVQDLHEEDYKGGVQGLIDYLNKYKINGVITPYYNTDNINRVRAGVPRLNIVWVPHHIDHDIFRNYNMSKKYDILLFGNDHPKFYPFRNRVIKLLESRGVEMGIKVHKVPRPRNYFKYNAAVSNASLSKMMSQSWLTLCTSSNLDYLLGKYFEASFSGSVVCGNMASDGVIIWEDNFVHIEQSMDDNTILKIISNALQDKEKLKKIASVMQQKMEDFYCLRYFTHHLYEQL